MPRGYRGYGRGYGAWGGRCYVGQWWPGRPFMTRLSPEEQKGAVYIGPCRCGFGPHAYYRLSDGRIVHASAVPAGISEPSMVPTSELDRLREENEELRSRLRALEEKIEKR